MNIKYLGHAGFIVEVNKTKILIDPFFHTAFFGSWFPYPDNCCLEEEVLNQHFDYLYISHTHEDHFDVEFLKRFQRKITVLCPNYRSRSLAKKFNDLGYNELIELKHKETYKDKDWSATVYLDTSHKEDSGILIANDQFRFLDLNDCNTTLSELPTEVDLLAAQYSGAMWYPNCYEYSPEVEQEKTNTVVNDLLKTLSNKLRVLKPKRYLPCAGPACFLDPSLQKFNNRTKTIFPTWNEVADHFKEVPVVIVQAGDSFINDHVESGNTKLPTDVEAYSERRTKEWDIAREVSISSEEVMDYFVSLRKKNLHVLSEDKSFRLYSDNKVWTIYLGKTSCAVEEGSSIDKGYEFFVPSWVLSSILKGESGWEEAFLSMRVKFKRNPDVYDVKLMGLLRYGHEIAQTLQMVKDEKSSVMITREGVTFQRYCPHAGEDLQNAEIKDGIITCPRHQWKWDLKSGECIKGGSLKLKCEGNCSSS